MALSLVYSDIASSMTIPAPTVSDGDLMLVSFVNDGGTVGASLTGWTSVQDREHAGVTLGYETLQKVASSESGDYAFSGSGQQSTIHIFRDSVGGGTWSIPDNATSEATDTDGVTAAVADSTDDVIFCAFTNDGAKTVSTAPSGMTAGEGNAGGSESIFCYYEVLTSPNAADTRTLVWSGSDQIVQGAIVLRYTTSSVTAALTGTATATINEDDITTGGKTVIITLTGDTFVTGTTSEDGIAGGSDSDKTGANKWDALIKTDLDNTDVVLSVGDTVATITLPAYATYDSDEQEGVTWTIPAASLTTSTSDIIATPTFTIDEVTTGRIMSSLANNGGLAGFGGIAGKGGGLAG